VRDGTGGGADGRPTVVILGGGPAGLMAAWKLRLAPSPPQVMVIEALAQPGGLCLTVERDGYRFDLGGHRFISRHAELVARVKALMGDTLLVRERTSRILLGGRSYQYPLSASNLMKTLPAGLAARGIADYGRQALARRRSPTPVRTFEEWVTSRFGATLFELFFKPYTEKLWGLPTSELSADWAAQRISLMNLADVGKRLVRAGSGQPRTYAREYYYPRLGIGQLFEVLVQELERLGVWFVPSAWVTGLEMDGDRAVAVRYGWDDAATSVRCDQVISTLPLGTLAQAIQPADRRVDIAAKSLYHRGLRFLNVMLDGPPLLDATWAYVSEPRYVMTRIQEPTQRSPFMAPPGKTGVMLEVPCDPGDPLWEMDDDALFARCATDLAELGYPIAHRATGWFSTRAANAYPVYTLNYRAHRQRLLDTVDGAENIWTCGRQGLFRYLFMDTAMEMGWRAAEEVLAGVRPSSARMMELDQHNGLLEIEATTA